MVADWQVSEPELDVEALQVIGRVFRLAELGQREIVAALRPLGLTYGDFDVLNTLRRRADQDGTNPRDLARSALISSGAMTTRLDRLATAGLIERSGDHSDRRAVRVQLTAEGARLATAALDAVLTVDESLLAPLGAARRGELAVLLRDLLAGYESA